MVEGETAAGGRQVWLAGTPVWTLRLNVPLSQMLLHRSDAWVWLLFWVAGISVVWAEKWRKGCARLIPAGCFIKDYNKHAKD